MHDAKLYSDLQREPLIAPDSHQGEEGRGGGGRGVLNFCIPGAPTKGPVRRGPEFPAGEVPTGTAKRKEGESVAEWRAGASLSKRTG